MKDLLSREKVWAFYELIGKDIEHIESMSVSESEKERLYLIVDRDLRRYEDILKKFLIVSAGLGKFYERMGDLVLGLEGAGNVLDEFDRDAENFELAIEIFGVRCLYSKRDLGV